MKTMLLLPGIALLVSCSTPDVARSSRPQPSSIAPPASRTTPVTAEKPAAPKPYPLTTCLVSGEDLDEMDERVSTVHKGQVYEFCCKPCLAKFRKNPAKYEAMLAGTR